MHLKHKQQKNVFETQTTEAVVEIGAKPIRQQSDIEVSWGQFRRINTNTIVYNLTQKHNFIQVETN